MADTDFWHLLGCGQGCSHAIRMLNVQYRLLMLALRKHMALAHAAGDQESKPAVTRCGSADQCTWLIGLALRVPSTS